MKKIILSLAVVFSLTGFLRATSVMGELYYPFTRLHTFSTKYFDIIYSAEGRDTASALSEFADGVYEKISGMLKTKISGRIAVLIASGPQMENGFSMPFPYNHIVLIDYQAQTELNHKEFLKDFFLHELTHAISLNAKSDFFYALCGFFGNYLSPNYSMPEFMIEGVTVSFESLEGYGRVNDPAVAEEIRQDILEGKFKNPSQATGAYDLYPSGNIHYHYGGFFSSYLQKKYGMEKYNQLWQENGGAFPYTLPLVYDKVYPTNIFDDWDLFRESMRFTGPVDTNLGYLEPSCLMKKMGGAENPVVSGGRIIYSDTFDLDVKMYDPKSGRLEILFDGTGDLAVSPDGKTLLVNSLTYADGVVVRVARFFDLEKRVFLDRRLNDYGYVSFFNGDVIAVKSRGHKTDLVVVKKDGSSEMLLKGTENVSFNCALQAGSNRIVFLMTDGGKRSVAALDTLTKKVSVLQPEGGWKAGYPVTLGIQENKILFSYNDDFSFYKAAILDGDKLYLQTNNVSGGVFSPVIADGEIYYIGSFSEGKLLLKYPAVREKWNGVQTRFSWKPVTIEPDSNPAPIPENKISDYNPVQYLLPHFFIPYLTLGKDYLPDSIGLYTLMNDPMYDNNISLLTTYNYFKNLLNVNASWENTGIPFHWTAAFSDTVSYRESLVGYFRQTGASFDVNYTFYYLPSFYHFTVGAGVSDYLGSYDNGQPSAYLWDYTLSIPVWSLYMNYSTAAAKKRFFDYKGFSLTGYYDYSLNRNVYKSELAAYWYPSVIPLEVRLNAAYSVWKLFSPGSYSTSFGSHHYPVYKEYASLTNASDYYLSGEVRFPLFNLEIQQGLWLLPLYFNRLYMTAGYRAAYLDVGYLHSAFARLVLITSPLYGGYVPNVNLYFEVYYKINNDKWGMDYNYVISY